MKYFKSQAMFLKFVFKSKVRKSESPKVRKSESPKDGKSQVRYVAGYKS